ncbi:MAG: uroporphyrinogen decarboxylase family protein [Thermoleophilia bacterium]|nr:uroporphyrinogen decarboxylase family protein [Thermoleophilia bacterium]
MDFNVTQWLQKVLDADSRQAMPITTSPGMELTGKPLGSLFVDGQAQSECIVALARKYPSIAALTQMDLSVEAEAFGAPVKFSDSEAPTVARPLVADVAGVEALAVPRIGAGRTWEYIRAARLAAGQIGDRPMFGGIIGPFSLACRLMDMGDLMSATRRDPDLVHALLEKCTAFLVSYASAFKEAGANGVLVAEPAAGLISPAFCQTFSSDYVKLIVDGTQDEAFVTILHNCGNTVGQVSSMLFTGARGLHFGNVVDMGQIMPQLPEDVLGFGNVDPLKVMKMGEVFDVKSRTLDLLEAMGKYKNFVLSTGCEVPPGATIQNLDAFYKTLDIFNMTQAIRTKWLFGE